MTACRVVVPAGIDDPRHPSGGNVYDRRALPRAWPGWLVGAQHQAQAPWPWSDPAAGARLSDILDLVPTGQLVLVDGLVASTAPDVVVPRARQSARRGPGAHARGRVKPARTRTGTGGAQARRPSSRPAAGHGGGCSTTTTSRRQVYVAEPGVEIASLLSGTAEGNRLLCVGAVTRLKGIDLLVDALADLFDLPWACQVVGPLDTDPGFVKYVRRRAHRAGLGERLRLVGPLTRAGSRGCLRRRGRPRAASRAETYGMVVTEAIGHGVPVVATAVGGVPEALGRTADGRLPGLLATAAEAGPLTEAIRAFLIDDLLRRRLRLAARDRRELQPVDHHGAGRPRPR